jgi:hypothetical protein
MSAAVRPVPCAIRPRNKRAKRVGDDLVRDYGERKSCTIDQVRESNRRASIALDMECWSYAMFNSQFSLRPAAPARPNLMKASGFFALPVPLRTATQCSGRFRNSIVIKVSGVLGFLRNFRHRFA